MHNVRINFPFEFHFHRNESCYQNEKAKLLSLNASSKEMDKHLP